MKNYIVILSYCFLSLYFSIYGQNDVVIGKIDSIQSDILSENRKLMIYVPFDSSNSKTYPVVYLLDGDAHFTSVVGMIEQLSQINGNTITPEMIVVAIPNTNRTRDLTPTKAEPNPPMAPKELVEQSGGGKNFLNFMEKELFPYIEANYPTASYRMLIGHSFGGLFVMNALLEKTEMFNSYIAIDPSMWWDNKKLLNTYKTTNFNDDKYNNRSLYLGIANTLDKGMDTISMKKMNGPLVDQINSNFDTRDIFRSKKNNLFAFQSKYYENDTHGSAPLITTYDGLRYIFNFYQFNIDFADVMKPNTDIVDRMKAHYTKVSETLGYENKPDEAMINGMGYQLMQMNMLDVAGQFFKMNVDYYPLNFNVYDSLGDYYLAIDNKIEAKKNFEKALSVQENPDSRRKLEQLKQN